MGYKLDVATAKSADNMGSGIRETGKYVGQFTRAEALVSQSGTQGVGFSFKSKEGQTADYLDLYTMKENGDELPSMKALHAIMACLKIREINEGKIKFEKWDTVARQRLTIEATGYPDLLGKDIGLLLQKEIYTDNQGKERERVIIYGIFQAGTELTASEVLTSKTKPENLEKMLTSLMARPVRDSRKQATKVPTSNNSGMPDDDVPW